MEGNSFLEQIVICDETSVYFFTQVEVVQLGMISQGSSTTRKV
jgi:hypothetical protein